jgi:hypothetical protein
VRKLLTLHDCVQGDVVGSQETQTGLPLSVFIKSKNCLPSPISLLQKSFHHKFIAPHILPACYLSHAEALRGNPQSVGLQYAEVAVLRKHLQHNNNSKEDQPPTLFTQYQKGNGEANDRPTKSSRD